MAAGSPGSLVLEKKKEKMNGPSFAARPIPTDRQPRVLSGMKWNAKEAQIS